MIAAIASAALIVAASLVVGAAVIALAGRREPSPVSGPLGLALLLVACGLAAGWGADGTTIAVVAAALTAASAAGLVVGGAGAALGLTDRRALAAALLAALAASIPFIAAGHVGILGVGLVNDDMASHLLLADWIDERFRPEPVLVDQGYPLGPHALVAGVSKLLAARSIDVFAGLVLAIPALTAIVAHAALAGVRAVPRILAAAIVALPYMAAAYLAQEAFKEPLIALFLLAFVPLLGTVSRPRSAIPLGVLAAGTVYVYSFPGLAWLVGAALVWVALRFASNWRSSREQGAGSREDERRTTNDEQRATSNQGRAGLLTVGAALVTLAVLVLPDLPRLLDFVDFRALDPGRANEGGLGNLPAQLSPLEALGIWPTSEFRLSASASSLPAALFYAGGAFGLAALAVALPRWVRRHGPAIPVALATAAILYLFARGLGTVYTSAKALAIAAPLVALIALGGLLASSRRPLRWLGGAFAIAAAASSFLVLRQAPVAPEAHADELAEIRPLVSGQKLLFLGRDNFVLHELRGSKPFTHVRNFYDPYYVEPNFDLEQVGSKFDFDSVDADTLDRFGYVLTTRAAYASGPPPGYGVIAETDSYELWEKGSPTLGRLPGEGGPEPGGEGACRDEQVDELATFRELPVLGEWSRETIENGESATAELELAPGEWELSVQYDATRPVTIAGPGLEHELPGNLDYRGSAPYWAAGTISVSGGGRVTITATIERPPLAGRLLGADSVAHLGAIAATLAGDPRRGGDCSDYVDWYSRR